MKLTIQKYPQEAWSDQIIDLIKPIQAEVAKVWKEFVDLRALVAGMHDKFKLKHSVLELLDAKISLPDKQVIVEDKRKRGRPPLDVESQKLKELRDKEEAREIKRIRDLKKIRRELIDNDLKR